MVPTLIESAVNFGPRSGLVGVLTQPQEPRADLAVVLLNSGIVHRVGPARLYVRLARRVAECGYPTFRMDLPGLGDSETIRGGQSISEQNAAGVSAAFDRLQELGIASRFALLGLCAGAGNSFQIACSDARVAGAVLIDPPTLFPTPKHRLHRTLAQVARPEVWRRLIAGRYGITMQLSNGITMQLRNRLRHRVKASAPSAPAGPSPGEVRALIKQALSGLVERGVHLLLVITGSQREVYSYAEQFVDAFPGIGLERVARGVLLSSADHTFTREPERAQLESEVLDWLDDLEFRAVARAEPARARRPVAHSGG